MSHEFLRRRLLEKANIQDITYERIETLHQTEWSKEFESLMRNRLIVGSFRYGRLGIANKPQYDRCRDIKRRLELYQETGNTENLVDIANLALCEFVEGQHPLKHFAATDSEVHSPQKD